MKKFFRKIVLKLLCVLARRRLKKFRGKIIAVTGSVGKTSTKEAIFTVLNSKFKVKRSKKSMNSEFGLPLTILDIDSGYSSATKWSWYLVKAFVNSFMADHSEILLLEMGVDKPKDMEFLISIVKPDIAVVTSIAHTHLADGQFSGVNEVFEEKSKLVAALSENGLAILNMDDEFLPHLIKKRGGKNTVTYGKDKEADYYATGVKQSLEGLSFILHHEHKRYEVKTGVLGEYQIYVLMPAIICGVKMGMEILDAVTALERYSLPPGRLNLIEAINGATIIDSSYNSSPRALEGALKVLAQLGEGKKRRVAVLGNMNELGSYSEKLHKEMGEIVPEYVDILITVGGDSNLIAERALEKGMDEKQVFKFKNAVQAAEFFKDEIQKNDLILVKGSQNNVRLERFIKALMAHPEDARELLVRQEKYWDEKL